MVQRHKILAVDDEPSNLQIIRLLLKETYDLAFATSGEEGLVAATKHQPDLLLLDVMMPGLNGHDLCRTLKEDPRTRSIPIIFVTAMGDVEDEQKGLQLGAVDYITKPISPPILKARVATHLSLYDHNRTLENAVAQRTKELQTSRLKVIQRLGRASEYKDDETGAHIIRMSHYSRMAALSAGISQEEAERLFNAAPMHDLGKIGIPDKILQKKGPLNDEEWALMKRHPVIGAEIIGEDDSELLRDARIIALSHHEKWDGSGYPHGLAGEAIPFKGRIVALADVFDALTSKRPYKEAWPMHRAMKLISEEAGAHFDPMLVKAFVKVEKHLRWVLDKWGDKK
ncbi:two-component system response regulator [Desulfoluna limicola]|uniref:Two-component system response regulator n=1 Tax=Desulfoluna limicola TaxID=2810562 RepID=A0ABM7PK78_9BACT|nr:HD domain-containing phosphohydrolase [Desulfoluna limicola]BCS97961.1 two-component system response regulator [Desulfoluna limicola]